MEITTLEEVRLCLGKVIQEHYREHPQYCLSNLFNPAAGQHTDSRKKK